MILLFQMRYAPRVFRYHRSTPSETRQDIVLSSPLRRAHPDPRFDLLVLLLSLTPMQIEPVLPSPGFRQLGRR